MDLVISFDDTGSMSSVRREVRTKINDLVNVLFEVVPELRIGVIIHNDYCDRDTIQQLDLTNDKNTIVEFVNRGSSCGGGDADECYELVLHNFHSTFSWKSDKRIALLIGDCNPHEKGYYWGGKIACHYNWREESKLCADNGIVVHTIQALGNRSSTTFYTTVASLTNGIKLDLSQFSHITQYITAVAYKQMGRLDEYESSQPMFNTNIAFRNMFDKLKGIVRDEVEVRKLEEKLVTMGRFQVIPVPIRSRINDFVNSRGIHYTKGRGFYQLIKSETVQDYKEIVMVHKTTGETVPNQAEARRLLGLPLVGTMDINPKRIDACRNYDVYVQSTSYTRQLDAGTNFLYELHTH